MRVLFTSALAVVILVSGVWGQTKFPKREFRGEWVASVNNIDWPSSKSRTPQQQRDEFVNIANQAKAAGLNALLVQIRPSCDAFYPSSIEPWSEWLTGQQNTAPSPYYDPLAFMIDETHKRGMEFHAWLNPYRAVFSSSSSVAYNHITMKQPGWVLTFPAHSNPYKMLNPGLSESRAYVVSVILDIVRRYDVDGIHFDDYFYPYPYTGMDIKDSASYAPYKSEYSIGDWRRLNVNKLIQMIYDSIQVVKPRIKFGISPFGIYRPQIPPGISGMDAYTDIYCDPLQWLTAKKVDYIMPQLYWKTGGSQDYSLLMPWWASKTNGRHLYTGNAAYRMGETAFGSVSEILSQIKQNRQPGGAQGVVMYNSGTVTNNTSGLRDSLRTNHNRYPALPPTMPWKDSIPPLNPSGLTATVLAGTSITLKWQKPTAAADGDTVKYYVIYRALVPDTIDFDDPRFIRAVMADASTQYVDAFTVPADAQYRYAVTACDKLHNESVAAARTTVATGIQIFAGDPTEYRLLQNYPNPFNPGTVISFTLAQAGYTTLKVYDLLGREVVVLVSGNEMPGGHTVEFNGSNLASGVYLYRLVSGSYAETKRMILQK